MGPNKVIYLGFLQFLIDRLKLLFKEWLIIYNININYLICLIIILIINFFLWIFIVLNYLNFYLNFYLILLILILVLKLIILKILLIKLKSIYSQIRLIRIIVQFISYDILIIIILFFIFILIKNIFLFKINLISILLIYLNLYIFLMWRFRILIEIIRLPFDFYESESELISGFNLEFNSFKFIFIFIIEYLDLIVIFYITSIIFINKLWLIRLIFILFIVLWLRGIIVRYRYDIIVKLIWKKILLYRLIFLIIYFNFIF